MEAIGKLQNIVQILWCFGLNLLAKFDGSLIGAANGQQVSAGVEQVAVCCECVGGGTQGRRRAIVSQQFLGSRYPLLCAHHSASRVPQVVLVFIALDVAHSHIGVHDLALQLWVIGLFGKIVEISQSVLYEAGTHRRGARQPINRIRVVE